MNRMILRRLTVSGNGKPDAVLTFETGLNVISGDSDTGKTFAFQCLDYILGAETPPKSIVEASGYSVVALDFVVADVEYRLERLIGSHKVDVISKGEKTKLSGKHDATNTKNISRYLLQLLHGHDKNINLKRNSNNEKRTLSFRDVIHLCTIDETDIIAEASSFQSAQYTERTVRKSVLKYIVTGIDDTNIPLIEDAGKENIRRSGVVDFLEKKKQSLQEKIDAIENDPNYKSYITSDSISLMLAHIKELREGISINDSEITKNNAIIQRLKVKCFSDEAQIAEFEKLKKHYSQEREKFHSLESYSDFLTQLPSVSCPVCGQLILPQVITPQNTDAVFKHFSKKLSELSLKIHEITLSIADINERLALSKEQIRQLHKVNGALAERISGHEKELKTLNKNISLIRHLDSMKKSLEIYKQELISVNSDIIAYSERVKGSSQATYIDFSDYDMYCHEVETVLKSWGFGNETEVSFDPNSLDLLINGKERISWGKGYRAFIMSAMVIGLMRYCYENNRLHPGFVIIDSPLVSLKERTKDPSGQWIEDHLERNMVENILQEDCFHQVIIFENKDIKYGNDYNYVEFFHSSDTRKGFIPTAQSN